MTQQRKAPAIFIGHGSPMNAINYNPITQNWQTVARHYPAPGAILVISAHWLTRGTRISAATRPGTIHDFGGFPPALYARDYPAPGAPELARAIAAEFGPRHISLDERQGLDHGAWSVLLQMYPNANVPVLQLSLDMTLTAAEHYRLGQKLNYLRRQGVMILGSGNVVHNLRRLSQDESLAHPWASEFNAAITEKLRQGDDAAVMDFPHLVSPEIAALAHPSIEHLLPLLYVLGAGAPDEHRTLFNPQIYMGAIGMLSLIIDRAPVPDLA